ncbi:MAG TPA: transposase, partial [Tissierellia bacterium]|nr:transposase [Tissierellia bacterium]
MHDANQVKKKLNLCLDQLENNRHRYTLNPTKDFTRRRKISFRDIMEITLGFAGKSLASELMDYFDYDPQGATVPAFVQQRDKVLPDAFRDLFDSFNQQFAYDYTYHGYRLLAVDGTDLLIPTDPLDQETYNNAQHVKGFNTLHINALYDLLNRVYLDVEVQPLRKANERTALSEFIPRLVDKRRAII